MCERVQEEEWERVGDRGRGKKQKEGGERFWAGWGGIRRGSDRWE